MGIQSRKMSSLMDLSSQSSINIIMSAECSLKSSQLKLKCLDTILASLKFLSLNSLQQELSSSECSKFLLLTPSKLQMDSSTTHRHSKALNSAKKNGKKWVKKW